MDPRPRDLGLKQGSLLGDGSGVGNEVRAGRMMRCAKPMEGRGRLLTERRRHGNDDPFQFRERRGGDPNPEVASKPFSGPTHVASAGVTAGMVSSTELRVLQ